MKQQNMAYETINHFEAQNGKISDNRKVPFSI